MDDKMIIDFINNVEPDMSYGSSDGMTRAMVESAENMALINDYIVESTYEVYTEAEENKEDKKGFFGKMGLKVSAYFTLFMNIIKKFITKIKGYFLTAKRKLTVAMAKAVKAIGNFVKNRVSDLSSEKEVETFKWSPVYGTLQSFIQAETTINDLKIATAEDSKKRVEELKSKLEEVYKQPLLVAEKSSISKKDAEKFFKDRFSVDINKKMDEAYNSLMNSSKNMINGLSNREKDVKNRLKKASSRDEFNTIKNELKGINIVINGLNSLKYNIAQKIASSCMKYYKKLFSAVRSVIGGSKSSDKKDEKKEPAKQESASILDMIK